MESVMPLGSMHTLNNIEMPPDSLHSYGSAFGYDCSFGCKPKQQEIQIATWIKMGDPRGEPKAEARQHEPNERKPREEPETEAR